MGYYSIRDLEKLSGIKAHTIRIWEKRYNIVDPLRTDTNIRHYTDADLKRLLNISALNRNGIKISRLARMDEEEISQRILELELKPGDVNTKVEGLLLSMMSLDEKRFRQILDRAIREMGFEATFIQLIREVMNRVGVLWLAGTINPAQEHFLSNMIRQKLIAEIDALKPEPKAGAKRFLLFLPEGEWHELGLLFLVYLIKSRGHECLYFGQSTPLESVALSVEIWPPDFVVLSIVSALSVSSLEEYLSKLKSHFGQIRIMVQGYQIREVDPTSYPELDFIYDFDQFTEFLKSL